ncbi:MAG: FmdB family zinc ribbon protein [bacterium]
MPIYEYICCTCNKRISLLQSVGTKEEDTKCPDCGSSVRKMMSSFACASASSPSGLGSGPSFTGGG